MVDHFNLHGDESFEEKALSNDISKEKFMIFSLSPISEDSENLNRLLSSTIVVTPSKLNFGDEFTYRFCDEISKICGTFRSIPETGTILLDYEGFCQIASKSDIIINTLASNLEITNESALEQVQNFFRDKTVIVQASGVQGTIYKAGSYIQSAGSAGLVANTLALARLAGVSGVQVLKAQPMLAIAIPTTGAMFFYGCAAIVGNNTIGKVCTSAGDVLALPMKGVEVMWNSYMNPSIQRIFGIPVILNMTQTFKTGPGYTVQEMARYIRFNKTSVVRRMKDKIINWLSN